MDRNTQKAELERLIRVSEASRLRLTADYGTMRRRMDVPARVRGSIKEHSGGWLGGSVVAGLAASFLFRRKKKVVAWGGETVGEKKRRAGFLGFVGGLLTLATPMLMALAKAWVNAQARHFIATQTLPPFLSRMSPLVSRFSKPR